MKKKIDNNKVGLIVATVIIIAVGLWIGIVGYYVIGNIPSESVDDFGYKGVLIFIVGLSILIILMSFKGEKNHVIR